MKRTVPFYLHERPGKTRKLASGKKEAPFVPLKFLEPLTFEEGMAKSRRGYSRTKKRRSSYGGVARNKRRLIRYGGAISLRTGRYGGAVGAGGGVERKYHDVPTGNVTGGTTWQAVLGHLNTVPFAMNQGTGDEERIGRTITVTAIHLQGRFKLPETSTPSEAADRVRLIGVLDTQCNGAVIDSSDLFEDDDNIDSFRKLDNTFRARTLFDKKVAIKSGAGAWDGTNDQFGPVYVPFNYNKKCRIKVHYSASSENVSSITDNNFVVLMIGENGDIDFSGICRIRYKDA